jgi:hypothetical protein
MEQQDMQVCIQEEQKKLLVYHRRSLHDREEASTKNRAHKKGRVVDALIELGGGVNCRYVSAGEVLPTLVATLSMKGLKASMIVARSRGQ